MNRFVISVGNTDLMKKELRLVRISFFLKLFRWKYRPDEEGIKTNALRRDIEKLAGTGVGQ